MNKDGMFVYGAVANGYWRGHVWGPMSMLVFWSLQEYDHLPIVREGRKAFVSQMERMMLETAWRPFRHVCENFPRNKGALDCTGGKFYIWGANPGLQRIIEDGMYNHSIQQSYSASHA